MKSATDVQAEIDRFAVDLESLRALLVAWEGELRAQPPQVGSEQRQRLVQSLEELFIKRVLVQPAFSLILRLDPEKAQSLLLRRYVGRGVSADTKFGGYQFELSQLLSELVAVGGQELVARLVLHASFDAGKLTDPRVIESLCDALSLDSVEAVQEWLRTMRPKE